MDHVYKTINDGQTWTDIGSNLPDIPCNNIIADPSIPDLLFLATDVGVYYTKDGGTSWQPVGDGMPIVVCTDLKIHQPSRTLVVGTYGRSAYKLDLNKFVGVKNVKYLIPDFYVISNPFNHELINVSFTLLMQGDINLSVYDVTGKLISNYNFKGKQGNNKVSLGSGNLLSGIYLVNLKSNDESKTVKIFLN